VITVTPASRGRGEVVAPARRHVALLMLPIAWGVLLFGGVYPWVYRPLLVGVSVLGLYWWMDAPAEDRAPARPLAIALLLLALLVAVQLIPLPASILARISPGTDAALQRYDVGYATSLAIGERPAHALSIAPDATRRGLAFLIALSAFILGVAARLPRIRIGLLVRTLAGLGAALALFGIVQRATFNDRIYWVWEPINVASNAFGPFVNRNHFAGWMLMTASLTACYIAGLIAVEMEKPGSRTWADRARWLSSPAANRIVLLGAALLLMVLAMVWTLSRSGMAAMTVAGMLVAIRAAGTLRGRAGVVGASLLLGAVVLAVTWRGAETVAGAYAQTNTLAWRLQLWSDTLPIVKDFWLFGTGLNTYGVATLVYPLNYRIHLQPLHVLEAHNDYLQLLAEGGVLLAIAALAVVLVFARAAYQAATRPQRIEVAWVRAGALVGMVAIAIQETVDFSLQMPGNAVLFALLMAIALHRSRQ
jgi:O-antigen ligase